MAVIPPALSLSLSLSLRSRACLLRVHGPVVLVLHLALLDPLFARGHEAEPELLHEKCHNSRGGLFEGFSCTLCLSIHMYHKFEQASFIYFSDIQIPEHKL